MNPRIGVSKTANSEYGPSMAKTGVLTPSSLLGWNRVPSGNP